MSKRGMDIQGGGERYGEQEHAQGNMMDNEAPRQATAAQLARRKIIQPKGRAGSGRNSRQASPAVAGFPQSQTFQPPPSANSFNFSFGSNNTPSFGANPPASNGTPSFSFGATPADTSNGGSSMFGQTNQTSNGLAGNGNVFGASNSQPQTNGFGTSTTSSFNFGPTNPQPVATNGFGASNNAFGGFGTTQPSTSAPPSFAFGASNAADPKPSTPAFSFGSTAPKETMSSFAFAASTQDTTKSSAPSFTFGSTNTTQETPKAPASAFSFNTNTQPNPSSTSSFAFNTSKPDSTTPAKSFAGFGMEQKKDEEKTSNTFGSSSTNVSGGAALGQSIFSNLNAPQQNGVKAGLFTASQANPGQAPATASLFSFTPNPVSTAPSKVGSDLFSSNKDKWTATESTSTPSNMFSASNATKSQDSPFKFGQPVNSLEQAAKVNAPFSGISAAQSVSQSEDANMTTPEHTPQKSAVPPTSTPAIGKSLFDRMEPRGNTLAKTGVPVNLNSSASQSSGPISAEPRSLFERISRAEPVQAGEETPQATTPTISITKENHFQPSTSTAKVTKSTTTDLRPDLDIELQFQHLNEGLLGHLQNTTSRKDWTPIFKYYLGKASEIAAGTHKPRPASPYSANSSSSAVPPTHVMDFPKPARPTSLSQSNPPQTPSANLFAAKPNVAPATAPLFKHKDANAAYAAEAPATGKRARTTDTVSYPELSEKASKTARLFASTLDKPGSIGSKAIEGETPRFDSPEDIIAKKAEAAKPDTFTSSTPSSASTSHGNTFEPVSFNATSTPAAGFTFKPTPSIPASTPSAGFTFKPTSSVPAPTPAAGFTFKPASETPASTAGLPSPAKSGFSFKPSVSVSTAGADDAFAAFAAAAKANAATEKKKRKAADYDSDEEDEATWEAKDKAQQEAKRRQIEEAAKSAPKFVFKPATPAATSDKPTFGFGGSPPDAAAKPTSTSSLFAPKSINADKAEGEKAQGPGDHTWKPETPIKFGSSAQPSATPSAAPPANPLGGLFGSSALAVTPATKLAPPALGFNFGRPNGQSVDTSRATTPGVTTDGEASTAADSTADAEGEPSDEPKDKQIEDMTALLDEEKAGSEVLYQTEMSKAMKMDEKKTDTGMQSAWVDKGKGPLYILRNKTTGKTRILLKVPPLGRAAMNFALLKNAEYVVAPGKQKIVRGMFVDHLSKDAGKVTKPSLWTIQVREPRDAVDIARILTENR